MAADLPTREQFIAAHVALFGTSPDFAGKVYDAVLQDKDPDRVAGEVRGIIEAAQPPLFVWERPEQPPVREIAPLDLPEKIKHVICSACGWSDATVEAATGLSRCWRCGAEEEFTPEHVRRLIAKRNANT